MDPTSAAQPPRPAARGAGTLPAGLGGLATSEASKRLKIFGPNRIGAPPSTARLKEWLWTLADPMASMLAVGGAVYLALGERREGAVLLLAVIPVLGIDVLMELRSRRALKSLALAVAPQAKVVRDGAEREIPTAQLVPGDLMVIAEGDILHADAVVRWAANLAVDESHLSGESEPQPKAPGVVDADSVFAQSRVITGHGYAEVTATGQQTRFGGIARMVQEAETGATPLQRKIGRMTASFLAVALVAAAGIFGLKLSRGEPLNGAFLYAISLAMSAIPEEFLLVFTLFLSVCAWRLARQRVLVRRLTSVETLGSTTVICLDKTGTLTRGTFSLEVHLVLDPGITEHALLEAAVLACEPHPADPMEQAIVAHCQEHGIDVPRLHDQWVLVCDYPFDPVGKHMSHVWRRDGDGGSEEHARVVAKGALEGILAHCRLDPDERQRAEAANTQLAAAGMRVLAIASRPAAPGEHDGDVTADGFTGMREHDERDLKLQGLVGFHDPLRPEVAAAIRECQEAGIKLKLVTGDHLLTAHAVAEAAGIAHRDDLIQTTEVIEGLRGKALIDIVERTPIFGRAQPEQKFAIVSALRAAGEIVAMTGDGINDAPALRRADIGVSMGRRGTEVAREASDLVLLDDDFSALVVAIREGRRVFADIQRAFLYLVAFKTMVVALALSAPLLGLPILLLPVDLVWLELIVHPVSALVFDSGTGSDLLMRKPPRDPDAAIIPLWPGLRSAISGALLAAGALWLYHVRLGYGEAYARGAAMTVIVTGSLLLVAAELYRNPVRLNKQAALGLRFWTICVLVAASLPLFMAIDPAANVLGVAWISPADFGLALLIAASAVAWQVFVPASRSPSGKIADPK
jgi:P-type Ca2+ transporter type 2C